MLTARTGVSALVTTIAYISLTMAAQNSAYAATFTVSSTSVVSLGLAVNVPEQAQDQSNSSSFSDKLENEFTPPTTDKPLPENRQGGATRGDEVSSQEVAPNKPIPKEQASQELTPKPLNSSPTDLTNW